jgi:hypothetical protein
MLGGDVVSFDDKNIFQENKSKGKSALNTVVP